MTGAAGGTYAFVRALVDEMVRSGVRHLCLCPGSRSTPVALVAASHPGLRVWPLVDERSAGFFALGLARMSRRPVALLSTSGTAAANFFPAVIEAAYGRVPLVVLTADRPPEMRDCASPQTIDQVRLYGSHAKWFVDVDVAAPDAGLRYARTLGCRAVEAAAAAPAGPVHLNLPFREPLVPAGEPAGASLDSSVARRAAQEARSRPEGRPFTTVRRAEREPEPALVEALAHELRGRPRGVIVCGPQDDEALPEAVARLAAALRYPILADPLSQVRCGGHDRTHVVDSYDALLRARGLADLLAPEVIVRIGGVPASKPLLNYMERHAGSRQVVVDGDGGWPDPLRTAAEVVHAHPARLSLALAAALERRPGPRTGTNLQSSGLRSAGPRAADAWLPTWRTLGHEARRAIGARLDRMNEPFEGKVFAELAALLPDGATIYVGNSMPVRDLDTFFAGGSRRIRILGNRGASGIDGLVSSALGAAAAGTGPVVLVLGDLAFYHDLGGLLAAKLHGLRATIVLINNDGGGIFSFLPQARHPEHFEALFATPTGLDFRHAGALYGAAFARAGDWPAFRARVGESLGAAGVQIVEVRSMRDRNVALHESVWAAVEAAVLAAVSAQAAGTAD